MASQPDPTGPIIEPGSPPEVPSTPEPAGTPVRDVPEIEPPIPDTDVPAPHLPETPPPSD